MSGPEFIFNTANREVHHKTSDTFEQGGHNLTAGAAIGATTALAEKTKPIAGHIDHAAVGEILKKAHLDEFLKAMGVWSGVAAAAKDFSLVTDDLSLARNAAIFLNETKASSDTRDTR
jgi:hypothetical protein